MANQYSTPARPKDSIRDDPDVVGSDIHESTEPVGPHLIQQHLSDDGDDDYGLTRRNLKRRRLSLSPILDFQREDLAKQQEDDTERHDEFEDLLSSANTAVSSPPVGPQERPSGATTAPRFILPSTPAAIPTSTPATVRTTTFIKPPRFRPPDDQEQHQESSDMLPDAFSPQRRGQKFLAGGLAAEVIGWIMNLDGGAPVPSSARRKEDIWTIDVVVDEVRAGHGAGMTLICGWQVPVGLEDEEAAVVDTLRVVKVILAGSGTAEVFQKANKVDVGMKIRIKGPVWEAAINGEKWGVAVNWEVLN